MSGYSQDKNFVVVAETRRRWSAAERQVIVEETKGASVSSVARRHGVAASLVFRWRREAGVAGKRGGRKAGARFVPVVVRAGGDGSVIEIDLAGGHKLRVTGTVETDALRRVIAALEGW